VALEEGNIAAVSDQMEVAKRAWTRAAQLAPGTPEGKAASAALASCRTRRRHRQRRPRLPRNRASRFHRQGLRRPRAGVFARMKYLHTMIRVTDPDATIRFFELLGLKKVRRMDNEKGRFT
jgi:hypothetical protein